MSVDELCPSDLRLVAFLAELGRQTGQQSFIDGGVGFAEVSRRYPRAIRGHDYSGKIAWSFACLFRATHQNRYRLEALELLAVLAQGQSPQGPWLLQRRYSKLSEQPFELTLDRTAEYCVWLYRIADLLDEVATRPMALAAS